MSRTKNSIRNLIVAIVGQGIGFVVSFIARIFFIRILGSEYLGLNGLFTNILTILSLAELGVGEAITFSLYKPLAENDTKKCKMLMGVYRKVYNTIGIVILVLGFALTPLLPMFISKMPDINDNIYLIYSLFVVNTAMSYFFSYKRNLIIADQQRYIATIIRHLCHIIFTFLEIVYLVLFKDFIGYLLIMISATLADNIFVSIKANKMYPYLKEKESVPLDKNTKNSIIKNTKAMLMHKIGGVIVNSTDNILLSSIVSLNAVGIYSNYYFITNALNSITQHFFNSVVASVGNMFAVDNEKKQYDIFKKVLFVDFWMFSFIAVCLLCLFNPFIELWLGEKYLFSFDIVLIIVVNFYIYGMRKSVVTFREASGLFYKDRWKALFEAAINLGTSILFASTLKMGTFGVFLGTLASSVTVNLWVEPLVLYKYGFKVKLIEYFKLYFMYAIITAICCFGSYSLCTMVSITGFVGFLIKFGICLVLPNVVIMLLFHKTDNYVYFKNLMRKFTRLFRRRKVNNASA